MFPRRIATALAAAAVVVLPAGAAHADQPSAQDATFLRAAYQGNLAEIQGGRIAWQKTTDPAVKSLAASLMRDHIHMNADLYTVARNLKVTLPMEPTAEQKALTERYQAAEATAFDEYYVSTQLAVHREALKMASEQIEEGSEQSVKQLAEDASPIITRHQQTLRDIAEAEGIPGYGTGSRVP
ncbi:DUF4142 domain-containing protein [Actinoplanes sp. NBC_00393]|uniref:DUF4142 domain-containing protein n=1 Tax=Actinoplanes sp. NBC_00393 TaxID=2975953 RepID=UPI002E1D33D1